MTNLKRLIPYALPFRRQIIGASLCTILAGLLSGAFMGAAFKLLDAMLNSNMPDRLRKLDFFTLVFLVVVFVIALTDYGQTYLTQKIGQHVLARLRSDLFAHFQSLSMSFFEKKRTGEMMSSLTNDLSALQGVMTMAVATSLKAPVTGAISIGSMFYFNWRLSLLSILFIPPIALLINRTGKQMRVASGQLQTQLAELNNYLQEKMGAMRLIQTFGTRNQEIANFQSVNDEWFKRTMKPVRLQAALGPTVEFIGMVGVTAGIWYGARDVVSGNMKAAAMLLFIYAIRSAATSFRQLANLNSMFKSAEASAERLFTILDTQPEVRDAANAIDLSTRSVSGHLRFEDVRFSYNNEREVLRGISFDIAPGEVVALAGLSGSGKTTISNLVPRLYDPTKGRVLLDGLDLRDVSLLSLRAHIGAVPQETTLFHGTIRDNIAYGKPDATTEEIVEAARRANADDFIRAQQNGYETPVGERGATLSGGQRQRLAIARALLRDPKILILDEATSSLDAESESLVQDALNTLMQGRTTLIIAHRFSTIRNANRILVLDNGELAESGTHEELINRGGLYARLYQMQTFASRTEENIKADSSPGESELFPTEKMPRLA